MTLFCYRHAEPSYAYKTSNERILKTAEVAYCVLNSIELLHRVGHDGENDVYDCDEVLEFDVDRNCEEVEDWEYSTCSHPQGSSEQQEQTSLQQVDELKHPSHQTSSHREDRREG
jgi:plasmid rolling circle replication initiator protein Rep